MVLFYSYVVMIFGTVRCYVNIYLYVSALNFKIYGIVSLSLWLKQSCEISGTVLHCN